MSRRVLDGWSFGLGLGILLLAGCTESTLTFGTHCRVATDCVGGTVCRDGACVTPGGVDGDVDSETEAQDLAEPDAEQSTQMDGDTDAPEAERDEVEMTDQEGEGERLEAPPNDTCAGALPLALDTPTFGTTRGANNDFVPGLSCTGSLEGGADVVYRLTLQKDEELSVYAVPQTAGFDLSIYLLPLCQDNPWPGCLAAADAAEAEARESFTFKADHSGEYFLVVDSRCGAQRRPLQLLRRLHRGRQPAAQNRRLRQLRRGPGLRLRRAGALCHDHRSGHGGRGKILHAPLRHGYGLSQSLCLQKPQRGPRRGLGHGLRPTLWRGAQQHPGDLRRPAGRRYALQTQGPLR